MKQKNTSTSSRRATQNDGKDRNISKVWDTSKPLSPLTADQKRQARAARARGLKPADLKEIPALSRAQLRKMVRANPYVPSKRMLTVRLDADVFEWLRGLGKGYQTKLNALLRQAMQATLK